MKKTIQTFLRTSAFCLLFLAWNNASAQCADASPTGDCDNDGITNANDLDDDNDGILDVIDGENCVAPGTNLSNYPAFVTGSQSISLNGATVATNLSGLDILHSSSGAVSGFSANSGTTGGFSLLPYALQSIGPGDSDPSIGVTAVFNYDFTSPVQDLVHRIGDIDGSTGGTNFEKVSIKAYYLGVEIAPCVLDLGSAIYLEGTVYQSTRNSNIEDSRNFITSTFCGLVDKVEITITANWNGGTVSSFLGGCSPLDTDNDGILDSQDTDADGDGCFDALEGAGNFSLADIDAEGRLTGGVDTNGVPTAAGVDGQEIGSASSNLVIASVCITDADNDGVDDILDDYPNDAAKAMNSYYPAQDATATVAFEDLWPFTGDYDFNDTAVDFNITTVQNASNEYVGFVIAATLANNGGAFKNGFAYEIAGMTPNQISAVSGQRLTEGIFALSANGTEQGQSNVVIPIFDNDAAVLGQTITVTIDFTTPIASLSAGSMAPFKPFIVIDGQRDMEVHLVGDTPTDLGNATPTVVGNNADTDGNYQTAGGLPWGILITQSIPLPTEKTAINEGFVHFNEWAESGGTSKPDWYEDKSGYRDVSKIKAQQ